MNKAKPFLGRRNKLMLAVSMIATAMSAPVLANESPIAEEELIVTGSYIKGTPGDSVMPVQTLDRSYIDSIGATTVADILEKLSINSGSENQADSFTQGATQGTSNVNLRGLGLSSTLVLINGRRQTVSGAITNDGSVFVDTSTIPVDALERVEVLKEGAASTYGSDAIAGVVNFILRKDFEGFELNLGGSKVTDGSQKDLDIGFVYGGGSDSVHYTISAHYMDRSPLPGTERRDLVESATSGLGSSFLLLGPSTVATGPYAGTYAAFGSAANPGCDPDDLGVVIPQFSGSRCGFNFGPLYNLVNTETRAQLYGNLSVDISDSTELFAELGFSTGEVEDNPQSPSYPDLTFPFFGATYPTNPFGVGVLWLGRPLNGIYPTPLAPRENDTVRASVELTGSVSDNWEWNTALTVSQNKYRQELEDIRASRLQAAFAGVGGPNNDEWLDPFADISVPLSDTLVDDLKHVSKSEKTTDLIVIDAVLSGELAEMPAGSIGAAIGVQYRNEGFQVETDDVYEITFDADGNPEPVDLIFLGGLSEVDERRNTFAVFAEAQIPFSENLEVTTAIRYEKLQDDHSIDPKIAMKWQVADNVALRSSVSTAFREASLSQKYASAVTLNGLQDYDVNGNPVGSNVFRRVAATGNPDVSPEQSTNYNFGVILEPTDSLDIKLDYWGIEYTDLITVENAQGKIIADPFGEDIIRDGLGNLSGVNVDYFNSSSVRVNGIDIESTWSITDSLDLGLAASHFIRYDMTLASGDRIDAAGYLNTANFARSMPEDKANISLNWNSDMHSASANINYISGYDYNPGTDTSTYEESSISSFVTLDTQYTFTMDIGESETALTIGAKNLLDEEPPHVTVTGNLNYDPKQHSPLGRVIYAKVKYKF